jgi:hypothetical protein
MAAEDKFSSFAGVELTAFDLVGADVLSIL